MKNDWFLFSHMLLILKQVPIVCGISQIITKKVNF